VLVKQENLMKSIAHMMLIDCGKASAVIRGGLSGPFTEAQSPPFNHWG
jgi:hypothetical protein